MKKRIAVIPGDGIGAEVTAEAVRVIEAAAACAGAELAFTEFDWGAEKYLREGVTLPAGAPRMLVENFDAALLGAMGDPRVPDNRHATDILLGLRFKLDLYANVRPVKLLDARLCPLKNISERDVDFVIVRENTEGPYVGVGGNFKQGTPDEVAIQEDVNTWKGVDRVIRYAFQLAERQGRKRLCMADKSNAMPHGHGLWQRVFAQVRSEYQAVEASHLYIDALAMLLVMQPSRFEVIVTNNMFGDILADIGAALQGGLGMAASGNINPEGFAMFEPVHGSAPPLAGKNAANPIGAILSAAMMAEHLNLPGVARRMEAGVAAAVRAGQTTTDIGGNLGTREAGQWIIDWLRKSHESTEPRP